MRRLTGDPIEEREGDDSLGFRAPSAPEAQFEPRAAGVAEPLQHISRVGGRSEPHDP